MKAIVLSEYGGPELFQLAELPKPVPQPGEITVQVHASAVDPGNMKRAAGVMRGLMPELEFPWVPGAAIAGVVDEVGPGVTAFRRGDAVYGYRATGGAYAEFVAVDANELAPKPASLDDAQAASIAVAGQTALLTMEAAKLQGGQTILILGAGGAVGDVALQLAKNRGARVVAVCRARSADRVRSSGADEVVDIDAVSFESVVGEIDVVLDTLGGEFEQRALSVLKPGGLLVAIVQPPSQAAAEARHVRAVLVRTQSQTATLAELGRRIDAGEILPFVGQTFMLNEAAQAWKNFSAKRATGKVVIRIKPHEVAAYAPNHSAVPLPTLSQSSQEVL